MTQMIAEGKSLDEIDWKRNGIFVLFGFAYLGGFQYWLMVTKYRQWFPTMDRFGKLPFADKLKDTAGMLDAPALKRKVAPLIAAAIVLLLSHKNQVAAAAAAAPWKFSAFATSTTRKIRNTKQTKSPVGILAKSTEVVQQLRFMTLPPATPEGAGTSTSTSFDPNELDYLKAELTAYLSRRQELGADEAAKRYVFGA